MRPITRSSSRFGIGALAIAFCFSSNAAENDSKAASELGRQVFTKVAEPQCGVCHTLKDAGTTGTIGANLEELRPDVARVADAVRKGLGVMPAYAGKLSEQEIRAVAEYVSRAAAGK
jgi:sulfite dehydrogenase